MHELNDFCVTLFNAIAITASEEKYNYDKLVDDYKDLLNHLDDYDDYLDAADNLMHLEYHSYKCKDFGKIFSPASAVLLLYATLIRSLHSIAAHYGGWKYKEWQSAKDPSGNELAALRALLESLCGKKIDVFDHPQVKVLIIDRARSLRNKFVHGEWEAVEKALVGVNIRACFESVSHIFSELELLFEDVPELGVERTKLA
jgi:hypothetical protein